MRKGRNVVMWYPLKHAALPLLPLLLVLLLAACDVPPDPNPPYVPPDGLWGIAELTDEIDARPQSFDTGDWIKMKGSWESFSSRAGEVGAYDDPLGKLYRALVRLQQSTAKKIQLDCSAVNGGNIPDSTPVNASLESRPARDVISQLRFPADMTTVGAYAFYGCGSLTDVFFTGGARPELGAAAFPAATALWDRAEDPAVDEERRK
jgi:hypothetical protein